MPLIKYVERRFGSGSLRMIERANEIVREYAALGFSLTLRQLYYQFVSRALLGNRQTEYKRLGSVISDARLAGLLDWEAVSDRTRWIRQTDVEHGNPDTWLTRVAASFRKAHWESQAEMVEVWIEKDALIEVVEQACEPYRVPHFACRGYVSQSEVWAAAQRIEGYGKPTTILHLGDHDPSGIDMSRDIEDRLRLFCEGDGFDGPTVKRIALNWDQVQQYTPPPNPAKMTDTRAEGYVARFGSESWELDALAPTVIAGLIRAELEALIDADAWRTAAAEEKRGQDSIRLVGDNWQRVTQWLS